MRLILIMGLLVIAIAIIDTIAAEEEVGNLNAMPQSNTANLQRNDLSISGIKFEDMNRNALFDANEPGIPGWVIRLKRDNTEIANTKTDESGMYSFTNLGPGSYTIVEDQKTYWIQSVPGSGSYNITLTDKAAYSLNFGNFRRLLTADPNETTANNIYYVATVMNFTHPQMQRFVEYQMNLTEATISPESYAMTPMAPASQHFDLLSYLPYNSSERYQGNCGNCWIWGSTGCIEIDRAVNKGIKERLSTQYFNSHYNGGTGCGFACCGGWPDTAANFYDGIKMAVPWSNANALWQDAGRCCLKSCGGPTGCTSHGDTTVPASAISTNPNYPITSIECKRVPTHGVGKELAIENIKNILHQDKAIAFCYFDDFTKFKDFWYNQPETAVYSSTFTVVNGGHCVTCVGYNDSDPNNRYWIMVNSWGAPTNRPNGIFRLSMDINYDSYKTIPSGNFNTLYWDIFDITSSDSVWNSCSWVPVEQGGINSHQPTTWCPTGSFITGLDLDACNCDTHDSPVIGQARCCGLAGAESSGWDNCTWIKVEQGGINSHQPIDWCPEGSFITGIDLDGDRGISGNDAPVVGQVQCCRLAGYPNWKNSHWTDVEKQGINSHQPANWCSDGEFITAYDLDGNGTLSDHDAPIVGQAKCASPSN